MEMYPSFWTASTARGKPSRFRSGDAPQHPHGKSSDVRFSSTEKIDVVPMMTRKMEFSYKDGEDYVFSDPDDYETVNLSPRLWAMPKTIWSKTV